MKNKIVRSALIFCVFMTAYFIISHTITDEKISLRTIVAGLIGGILCGVFDWLITKLFVKWLKKKIQIEINDNENIIKEEFVV